MNEMDFPPEEMDIPPEYAITRVPPNDVEAEQAVLSSMIFNRDAVAIANEILQKEDFYRPDHGSIFLAMIELFSANISVDAITLCDKLAEQGILEQIGGRAYIAELAAAYYTSAHIREYSQIVADKAVFRKFIKIGENITAIGFEARMELQAALDTAEKSVFGLSSGRSIREFTKIKEIIDAVIDNIEKAEKARGQITGLATGFTDLDHYTAGLQNSDLIIIGARPAMGKTALLLNIAQHAAVRNAVPTAFFSLEMSKEQLGNRMLCVEAKLDAQKVRVGSLDSSDWERIMDVAHPLSTAPIFIDDTPGIGVTELRTKCRRLKLEKELGLVVIDYLQLMTGQNARQESRQIEISEISRALKGLAKELNVPILTAAQLSRALESRKDKRPLLSDLRESGAIEQDADIVAFLYRDSYYNPDLDPAKQKAAELIIAKQRNGPTGTVHLTYVNEQTRFENADMDEYFGQ
ncbi:MAG: replicative DNA helicase [Turicibacter sp.]|nr:replicative DNA helicase [Turicibacter sp.]